MLTKVRTSIMCGTSDLFMSKLSTFSEAVKAFFDATSQHNGKTTAIVHSYDLVRLTTVDYAGGTSGVYCVLSSSLSRPSPSSSSPPLSPPPLHTTYNMEHVLHAKKAINNKGILSTEQTTIIHTHITQCHAE